MSTCMVVSAVGALRGGLGDFLVQRFAENACCLLVLYVAYLCTQRCYLTM